MLTASQLDHFRKKLQELRDDLDQRRQGDS